MAKETEKTDDGSPVEALMTDLNASRETLRELCRRIAATKTPKVTISDVTYLVSRADADLERAGQFLQLALPKQTPPAEQADEK